MTPVLRIADLSIASNSSISILLIIGCNPGSYCCGDGYNVASGLCYYPDDDHSFRPFLISDSRVIVESIEEPEHSKGFGKTAKIVCGVLAGLLGVVCLSILGHYLFRRMRRTPDNVQNIVRC